MILSMLYDINFIIGLLIIFVMDFVFKMGKQIGAKKS